MIAIYTKTIESTINNITKTLNLEVSADKIKNLIQHNKRLIEDITFNTIIMKEDEFHIEGVCNGESFNFDDAFEATLYLGGLNHRAIRNRLAKFSPQEQILNGGYVMLTSHNVGEDNNTITFSMKPAMGILYACVAFEYGGDLDDRRFIHDEDTNITAHVLLEPNVERYDGKRCNRAYFIKRFIKGTPLDDITLN